jgi:hypothetical protein
MVRGLKQFFSFFGSKSALSRYYPPPIHQTIIEPFAGSAGYACRYPDRDVVLVDADPVIVSVWRYLIEATRSDILALPLDIADVGSLSVAERSFIGFWWRRCGARPSLKPVPWCLSQKYQTSFWGERVRRRVAEQVHAIKHWRVTHGDYRLAPDLVATWFVDPPYQFQGRRYTTPPIDYAALAPWVRDRRGQVIACEDARATWLPFEALYENRTVRYKKEQRTIGEGMFYRVTRPE